MIQQGVELVRVLREVAVPQRLPPSPLTREAAFAAPASAGQEEDDGNHSTKHIDDHPTDSHVIRMADALHPLVLLSEAILCDGGPAIDDRLPGRQAVRVELEAEDIESARHDVLLAAAAIPCGAAFAALDGLVPQAGVSTQTYNHMNTPTLLLRDARYVDA